MLTSSSLLHNRFLPLVGRSFLIEYIYGSKNSPHMGTYEAPLTYLKTVLICASANPQHTQWDNLNDNSDSNIRNSYESCAVNGENSKHEYKYKLDGGNDINKKWQKEIRRRRWREKYGEESLLIGHINRRQRRNLRCMIEGLLPSNTAQDHLLQQQLIYYVNSLTNEVVSTNATEHRVKNDTNVIEQKRYADANVNDYVSDSYTNKSNNSKRNSNISSNNIINSNNDPNSTSDYSDTDEAEENDNAFPRSLFPNEEYDEDEDDEEEIKINNEPHVNTVNLSQDNSSNTSISHTSLSEYEEEESPSSSATVNVANNNLRQNEVFKREEQEIPSNRSMPTAFPWNTWLDVVAQYINTSLSRSLEMWTARVLLYDTIWTWLLGSLELISLEISSRAAKQLSSNSDHSCAQTQDSCSSNNTMMKKTMMSSNRAALIDKLYGASEALGVDEECSCYLQQIRQNERISLIASHVGLSSAVRSAIEELVVHEVILSIHKSNVLRLHVTKYDAMHHKVHNDPRNKLIEESNNDNITHNHRNNNVSSNSDDISTALNTKSNDVNHTVEISVRDLKRAIKHYRKR